MLTIYLKCDYQISWNENCLVLLPDEYKCQHFNILKNKNLFYPTLAALTALIFRSISTKATLTFSELSWRQYLSGGKSCSSNGWLSLLSKIIGRHYNKRETVQNQSLPTKRSGKKFKKTVSCLQKLLVKSHSYRK